MDSNPLTPEEQKELSRLYGKKSASERQKQLEEEKKRDKGYLFWCSEGCGFVDKNHRCEQWSNVARISPELIKACRDLDKKKAKKNGR
jgi:hypothetical protein